MRLNQEVWFSRLEFTLQTMSVFYPLNPNEVAKKKYYDFIQNLPIFFPEYPIGKNFIALLDKYPVTPYLDSRVSFMKWVHFITNKIRQDQKKPLIDFYDYLDKYYENYKPVEIRDANKRFIKKRYRKFGLFSALALLIVYLYKK